MEAGDFKGMGWANRSVWQTGAAGQPALSPMKTIMHRHDYSKITGPYVFIRVLMKVPGSRDQIREFTSSSSHCTG